MVATAIVLLSPWPVRRLADLLGLRSRGAVTLVVDLQPGAGVAGVLRVLEPDLSESEIAALRQSADVVRSAIVSVPA